LRACTRRLTGNSTFDGTQWKGDAADRQQTGSHECSPSSVTRRRFFMSKDKPVTILPDGGPDVTSAGVNWNEVPEFARHHVAWIDGRHGSAQAAVPPIDAEPVPKILYRLPALHPDRPTGSKAMLDAHGARARLAGRRAGAWIVSPFTGWTWTVFPDGEVHWVPSNVELPVSLRVQARNDVQ